MLGAALALHVRQAEPEAWQPAHQRFTVCGAERGSAACVIDGDTLAIGRRRVRLTGYDAPELAGACPAESALARQARSELARWLNAGPYEMLDATDAPRDRYGRELLAARRGGRELADHMIAKGLGRETGWGAPERDWCDQ